MNWKDIIIIIVLIVIAGCSPNTIMDESKIDHEPADQELIEGEVIAIQLVDRQLVDREWLLNSLDGEPLIDGTNIILAFDDSSFSGFAGCNGYGGPVETGDDRDIKFGEMASQAEGCIEPEGVLDQEINYLDQLLHMENYMVENSVLTLSNPRRGQTLQYTLWEPFEMDPELLENTHWNLLASRDFSLIDGSVITLSFSNGEMKGFGGCRDYQGEYVAEGDKIRFPVTMMLDEGCEDQDLLIQEGKFTTAFELSTHYLIEDDQLTLFLATGDTIVFERVE